MFHIGFVVVLLGAGMTRYMGYEGSLHIREGKSENRVISSESYIQASAKKADKTYTINKKKIISAIGDNDFEMNLNIDGEVAKIKYKEFVPNAITDIVEAEDGEMMVSMMVSSEGKSESIILKNRAVLSDMPVIFTLNNGAKEQSKPVVDFYVRDGKQTIR